MTAPRPDLAVVELQLAIALLNDDDDFPLDAEFGARLPLWLTEPHDGDCTHKPYTCNRCVAENYKARAAKFIQLLKLDALLAERAAHAIPDGWKLVPVEPTEEMNLAGYERLCADDRPPAPYHWEGWITPRVYRDMIAAAPQPPKGSAG